MTAIIASSVGLAVGGPVGALLGLTVVGVRRAIARRRTTPSMAARPVLLVMLVELRAGASVLSALQKASSVFPDHRSLSTATRVAAVHGLTSALDHADDNLRPALVQLARAQRSGASLSRVLRTELDNQIADEKAKRLARARALPVKLMIPMTLMMLPGLLLILYAPGLFVLFDQLTGPIR